MKLLKKTLLLTLTSICLTLPLTGSVPQTMDDLTDEQEKEYEAYYQKPVIKISNLKYFIDGYPDVKFTKKWDQKKNDWLIKVTPTLTGKTSEFYWSDGRFLPESELENEDKYWSLFTYYPEEIRDPATFTETERNLIHDFGKVSNRSKSKITPTFLFDAIYDTTSRVSTESHIVTIPLLGHYTNTHESIVPALKRVEEKLLEEAKTDKELNDFIHSFKSCDSYAWRDIETTDIRSLHSLGIAVDFLPKKTNKHLFWGWARDRFPQDWMDTRLIWRWIPPKKFIEIIESEGFIWGGKWVIWDNMHFEYRPEQLHYNQDINWK